jgi:hypothetical protein
MTGLTTPVPQRRPIDPVVQKRLDAMFPKADDVNRPAHYTSDPSGVECIQIVRHRNFNVGNAIKYLWRQGLKNSASLDPLAKQVQDLEKARWYIADEIARLKQEDKKRPSAAP